MNDEEPVDPEQLPDDDREWAELFWGKNENENEPNPWRDHGPPTETRRDDPTDKEAESTRRNQDPWFDQDPSNMVG
jgi:hypothetical protein